MTGKEKIIKFMEKKQEILARYSRKSVYFEVEDKRDIEKWSDERCDAIWKGLDKDGYCASSCPFCLYIGNKECCECSYGKRHGICGERDSGYYKLFSARDSITVKDREEIEDFTKTLDD